jgi:1,4-alpha-glucan branching enzyme
MAFMLLPFMDFAQENDIKGYKIDGDYIVFTFDKRDYTKATHHKTEKSLDFDDFDIEKVVVAGNFNNWSRKRWKMNKVDEHLYQLKKRISDFDENFNWEFKFVVNNNFWAEPSEDPINTAPAKNWWGANLNSFNLRILPAYISKNGNAKFTLEGYKNAKNVVLSGSFNRWDEHLYKMTKTENGWQLNLELPPNYYEYKFIVDGSWIEDPKNLNKAKNEFDEYNSFINIKKDVTFLLEHFHNAEKVILAGSFNNWDEEACKMTKTKNGWKFTTKLSGGKHHYKFIVDHQWKLDPANPIKEYDGNGHINSVKMVK